MRDGSLFYFPIRDSEQAWIDPASVVAAEIADACPGTLGGSSLANAPNLQSLSVQFGLATGQSLAPQLLPVAPGRLYFHAAPGQPAAPTPASATRGNFATFPTLGYWRLVIEDALHPDAQVRRRLRDLAALPVMPSVIWLGPVTLDEAFVFDTLPQLPRADVAKGTRGKARANDNDWTATAIAGFLKGLNAAKIGHAATAAQDPIALRTWPRIAAPAAAGSDYRFVITVARQGDVVFDGSKDDYEVETVGAPAAPIARHDPMHPVHGALPARVLLRNLREAVGGNGLLGAPLASNALADTVLPGPSSTLPRHHLVRFTRTWMVEDTPDCSQYFPSQRVEFRQIGGVSHATRLPNHGLVWVPVSDVQMLAGNQFELTLTQPSGIPAREMRAIVSSAGAWRGNAAPGPYPMRFAINQAPQPAHWQLRRRMGQEVIDDRESRPTGNVCVYHSLRRAVMALVNNRIAGGRLKREVYRNRSKRYVDGLTGATLALIRDAFEADGVPEVDALAAVNELRQAGKRLIDIDAGGNTTEEGLEANRLGKVLDAFFPGQVPVYTVGGQAGSPPPDFTLGRVFVGHWYSGVDTRAPSPGRFAFSDDQVGFGAPGALVAFGLAQFAVQPAGPPRSGSVAQQRDAIARLMLRAGPDRLDPGAALQFWTSFAAFDAVRGRNMPPAADKGHSPTFLRYSGSVASSRHTGVRVIDQNGNGESEMTISTPGGLVELNWGGYECVVWIAANWIE